MISVNKKISVEKAIIFGQIFCIYPLLIFVFSFLLGGIAFLGVNEYSLWFLLPVVAFSIILPCVYYYAALTKWRIWAFENVVNIFELEQSKNSFPLLIISETTTFALTQKDKKKITLINQLLSDKPNFIDDTAVPEERHVGYSRPTIYLRISFNLLLIAALGYIFLFYGQSTSSVSSGAMMLFLIFTCVLFWFIYKLIDKLKSRDSVFVVSNEGIDTKGSGFYYWEDISGENVNYRWSGGSSNPYYELNFYSPQGEITIPIKLLDIRPLVLQHHLYIYRGRFNARNLASPLSSKHDPPSGASL